MVNYTTELHSSLFQDTHQNVSIATTESSPNSELESLVNTTFLVPQILPQRAMRHRPPNVLPEVTNAAPDLDQLDDVSFSLTLNQKKTN